MTQALCNVLQAAYEPMKKHTELDIAACLTPCNVARYSDMMPVPANTNKIYEYTALLAILLPPQAVHTRGYLL
jgi:hypothetical protein